MREIRERKFGNLCFEVLLAFELEKIIEQSIENNFDIGYNTNQVDIVASEVMLEAI